MTVWKIARFYLLAWIAGIFVYNCAAVDDERSRNIINEDRGIGPLCSGIEKKKNLIEISSTIPSVARGSEETREVDKKEEAPPRHIPWYDRTCYCSICAYFTTPYVSPRCLCLCTLAPLAACNIS